MSMANCDLRIAYLNGAVGPRLGSRRGASGHARDVFLMTVPSSVRCDMWALGRARGVDVTQIERRAAAAADDVAEHHDHGVPELAAETFGIARALAQQVMGVNDEEGHSHETAEERWVRVRRWIRNELTKEGLR